MCRPGVAVQCNLAHGLACYIGVHSRSREHSRTEPEFFLLPATVYVLLFIDTILFWEKTY
jgi:hypothetical protein